MLGNISLTVKRFEVKTKDKWPGFILEILPEYFLLGVFTVYVNYLGNTYKKRSNKKPNDP